MSERTHTQTTASSAPPHSVSMIGNKAESECERNGSRRRKITQDPGSDLKGTQSGDVADDIKAVADDGIDDDLIDDHNFVL